MLTAEPGGPAYPGPPPAIVAPAPPDSIVGNAGQGGQWSIPTPPPPTYTPPPDAVVGNAGQGGQFAAPAPPAYVAPPDSIVGNTGGDLGGQFPGTASAPAVSSPGAPPGQIQLTTGYNPDYAGLIRNDPAYLAAQSAATGARGVADARRRAAVRQAFIRYGGKMPGGWSDQYGDIDQATQDAASGNQFSAVGQLRDNYSKSIDQFRRALAARGALQSGDLNYGEDQLNRGLGQQEYDASNAFLDQSNQAYSGFADVLGQNARDLTGAIGTAESNVYQNPAYRPSQPTYANYDAANSAKYKTVIYRGDDGQLYDAQGNVYQAAA